MPNDDLIKINPGVGINNSLFERSQEMLASATAGRQTTQHINYLDELDKYNAAQAKLSANIDASITDIVETGAKLDAVSKDIHAPGSAENITAALTLGAGGDPTYSFKKSKSELKDIKIDSNINIQKAVSIFREKIDNGSPEEVQQAIKDLRKIYQNAEYGLAITDQKQFANSYQTLVNYGKNAALKKYAERNINQWMQEGAPLNKNITPKSLRSQNMSDRDITNKMADFDNLRIGSSVYNDDDLQTFKSLNQEDLQDKEVRRLTTNYDMQYNRAVLDVLKDKQNTLDKQLSDADAKISKASNPQEKQLLINQKLELKKNSENLKNLQNQLSPFGNEDAYLKQHHKDLYEDKRAQQRQEYYKNQIDPNETSWSDVGEFFSRSGQYVASNFTKAGAGLQHIVGYGRGGFLTGLNADRYAPLSYRMGKDLNKNGFIDDSEVTKDVNGNLVTWDTPVWTDAKGEKHYNVESMFEQTIPIIADIATTVALSEVTGGAYSATLAKTGLTLNRVGKMVGLAAETIEAIRPGLTTFASVTASTFPRFYQEERKNFKQSSDALAVGFLRATAEGLTESILPETDFFKGSRASMGYADRYIQKALDLAGTGLNKVTAGYSGKLANRLTMQRDLLMGLFPKGAMTKQMATALVVPGLRKTFSAGVQESFEEVASHLANYLVDKYAASQNFEYEQTNDLGNGALWDTFVTSLGPSAIIGGGTAFGRRAMKEAVDKEGNVIRDKSGQIKYVTDWKNSALAYERANTARWNIANNPEMYKKLIAQKRQSGEYTQEEAVKKTAAVQHMANKFESMAKDIKDIKSLTNLLDDPNRAFDYFNAKLFSEELLNVNIDELSDEDRKSYEESVANTANQLAKTDRIIDQYRSMTDNDKLAIIKNLYDEKVAQLSSKDATIGDLLTAAIQIDPTDLEHKKKDSRFEFIANLNSQYQEALNNELGKRLTEFSNTLRTNPEELTLKELQTMATVFGPALQQLEEANQVPFFPVVSQDENLPQTEGRFSNQLTDAIASELQNRTILTEAQTIEQGAMNLNINEIRDEQELDMAIAELTSDEVLQGFVAEDAHPEWSDKTRFDMAVMLARHKAMQDQGKSSGLLELHNAIISNYYGYAREKQDSHEIIARVNKAIRDTAKSNPIRKNFGGRVVRPKRETLPSSVRGLSQVNQEIFDTFKQYKDELLGILANPNIDESEKKEARAAFSVVVSKELNQLNTLRELYSALSAIYPEHKNALSEFFLDAAEGNYDISKLDNLGFAPTFVAKIFTLAKTAIPAMTRYDEVEHYINSFRSIQTIEELDAFVAADHSIDPNKTIVNEKTIRAKRKEIVERTTRDLSKDKSYTKIKVGHRTYFYKFNSKGKIEIFNPENNKQVVKGAVVDKIIQQLIDNGKILDLIDANAYFAEYYRIQRNDVSSDPNYQVELFFDKVGSLYIGRVGFDILNETDNKKAYKNSPYVHTEKTDLTAYSLEDIINDDELLRENGITAEQLINFIKDNKRKPYKAKAGQKDANNVIRAEVLASLGVIINQSTAQAIGELAGTVYTIDPETNEIFYPEDLPYEIRNDLVAAIYAQFSDSPFIDEIPSRDLDLNFYDPFILNMVGVILDNPNFTNSIDPEYLKNLKEIYEEASNTIYSLYANEDIGGLFTPETPEDLEDLEEEIIEEDLNGIQGNQNKLDTQLGDSWDLSLSMTDTGQDDKSRLADPVVAFSYRVLHQFRESGMVGQDYNVMISTMMNIYKKVLSEEEFTFLAEIQARAIQDKNASFTTEELQKVHDYLVKADIPLHNQAFLDYIINNPKEIGTGVGAVFVDSKGNVLNFNKEGIKSTTGTPLILTLKKLTANPTEKALRDRILSNPNQYVIKPVKGLRSGKNTQLDLSNVVGDIVINTKETPETIVSTFGSYTLNKGGVYVYNPDSVYPYSAVVLPKAPEGFVSKIVEAYNNGKLPKGFPSEFVENPTAFVQYLNSLIYLSPKINNGLIIGTTKAGKVVFKKQNKEGKWVAITGKAETQKLMVDEAFKEVRYNINKDKLDLNEPSYLLTLTDSVFAVTDFPSYTQMLKSSVFGAKVLAHVNQQFALGSDETIYTPDNIATSSVNTDQVLPPLVDDINNLNEDEIDFIPNTPIRPSDLPELERSLVLENGITEQQNKEAQEWVSNHPIFNATPFIFDQTIAHPSAYAVWSKAGIFLFQGANYAEGYHEAWHEFSQYYLTREQKDALYAQAKKIYGELTPVELEERLAEDFRLFALSQGKVFPDSIKEHKESRNIFQKMWDFLTNLFSEKKTIDHYFGQLYKGEIDNYTRDDSQSYFTELHSSKFVARTPDGGEKVFSFKDGAKILTQLDSLFVSIANNMVADLKGSVVNVLDNKAYITATYAQLENTINIASAKYDELVAENPTPIRLARKAYLDLLKANKNSLFKFHSQSSSLFSDKVKKMINDEVVEEVLTLTEFAQFETAVNEQSQKLGANPLIITAIKSLPRYKNNRPVKDKVFGVNEIGDFDTNWQILQRSLSGSNSYADLYNRVKNLGKTHPQFKQLLSYLPDPKETDVKQSTLNFKNMFYSTFSMPYIDGYTSEITKSTDDKGQLTIDFSIYKAQSLDSRNLLRTWDNQFYTTEGYYKDINEETRNYFFNVDKYFEDFPSVPDKPLFRSEEDVLNYKESLYAILLPLGVQFSELGKKALFTMTPEDLRRQVERIYNKVMSLAETEKYIFTPLARIASEHKNSENEVVYSEQTALLSLLQYEIQANVEYANDMQFNALGKKVWSVNQHTYMTKILSALNDGVLYPTIDDVFTAYPQLNFNTNPNTVNSFIFKYLFAPDGNRRLNPDKTTRKLDIANLLGVKEGFEGEKTIDSVTPLKHYTDVMGFLDSGVEEINRFSGKSTTRGLVFDDRLRFELGMKQSFSFGERVVIPENVFRNVILPILLGEIHVTNNPSSKFRVNIFEDEGKTIPVLSYFQNILSPKLRAAIYEGLKEQSLSGLTSAYDNLSQDIKNAVIAQFSEYIAENVKQSNIIFQGAYQVPFEDLTKYHIFSFASRVEQHKLFFAHPYFYKGHKEIEKRISAWNAYGDYAVLDEQNLKSIKDGFNQRDLFLEHNKNQQIPVEVATDMNQDLSKISYIVLKDTPVNSSTALSSEAYNVIGGQKNGENITLKQYYTNKGDRQDAAAFATMDFYRRFFKLSTGVTEDMRKEFDRQDRIYNLYLQRQSGKDVETELNKVLNEGPYYKFTIKKLQYAGQSAIKFSESIPVFHKYSVKPILPSEFVNDPELAAIAQKLFVSGADYAVFKTGTKITETVDPVDLYNPDGTINSEMTPTGLIDMAYLKQQTLVENKDTFMSIFSTQFRKLVYKDSNRPELYEAYKQYINELVSLDKITFVDKLEDKEKLVSYLLQELSKKNVAEATKDLIKLKANGELQHSLDAMVDRTIMESAIVSSVTNDIIKQKVPGAQRVQFPVSLIRPGRTLGYYDLIQKDGQTVIKQAETIISFSKGYYPLLKLVYNGQQIGEFGPNGKPINLHTAITTLNQALQSPIFLRQNAELLDKALTIVAIRVPGQDYNSMENFRIVEFLPEESGEIILVPDEMVIKSGSDFDIDKLFCYDAFIEDDGTVKGNTISPEEAFNAREEAKKELKALRESKKELLNVINPLRQRVQDIINTNGFDAKTTSLKDLYETFIQFTENVDQEEEEEERPLTAEDLKRLQERFNEGIEPEKKEISDEAAKILQVLKQAKKENLTAQLHSLDSKLKALMAKERFLSNEVKSIRGRMTNNLLFNISERLTNSELFVPLLRPNSSDAITEAAELYGVSSKYTTSSYTNIVNPIYQLYVHQLNSFKSSLGVDAKNNVLHAILQKAGVYVIDKAAVKAYPLKANGKSTGTLDFTQTYDQEYIATGGKSGNRIGDINGQLISAHVDIEKDDMIARIYLNNRITPTANYMIMAGSSFKDIVKIINMSYKSEQGKKKRSTIVRYALGNPMYNSKNDFIQALLLEKITEATDKFSETNEPISETAQFIMGSLDAFGQNIITTSLKNRVAEYISKNPEVILNDESELGDLMRFVSWLSVEDQQDNMFTLSSNTDFDTFTPQNFESFRKGAQELKDLMDSKFFNEVGVKNVIFDSILSPFQLQQDIFDKLEALFPISANKDLTTVIIKMHRAMQVLNPRLDYDTFSRVFKNDLLYALFRNNVENVGGYESILNKDNIAHISMLYQDLRSRLNRRGITSDNLIFDNVTFSTDENTKYIRTGFVNPEIDYTVDLMREEFSTGFNWSHPELDVNNEDDVQLQKDMQAFFVAFAYSGIIGTQLNKKYDSYLPLIPEQIYTYPMSSVVLDFAKELKGQVAAITKALNEDYQKKQNPELREAHQNAVIDQAQGIKEQVNNVLSVQLDNLLKKQGNTFIAQFLTRFKELHPEFTRAKDPNVDLKFFKDYDFTRENTTPDSRLQQTSLTKKTENPDREYTPKEILELKPNEVFVFGANTVGHHGAGAAGYAQNKNAHADYTVHPQGTKGYWSEYGIVNQLMQGTNGHSFGIITKDASIINGKVKIGGKNSVPLSVVEESVVKMLETARNHPDLKFLVSTFGSNLAGWNPIQMRAILAKHVNEIPNNVILPKTYEVRDYVVQTKAENNTSTDIITPIPENFEELRKQSIRETFQDLQSLSENFKNTCMG